MIKDIHRIYIIDKEAKVFYLRENYISDSDSAPVDHALLSRFVGALESFITELGEEKTKIINEKDVIINAYKMEIDKLNLEIADLKGELPQEAEDIEQS